LDNKVIVVNIIVCVFTDLQLPCSIHRYFFPPSTHTRDLVLLC